MQCRSSVHDDVPHLLRQSAVRANITANVSLMWHCLVQWLQVYPQGKMSVHIDRLNIGDSILMRGPKGQYKYERNSRRAIGASSVSSNGATL